MNGTALKTIADTYQASTVRVSYEDMANPHRVGTVVEHRAGEFRVIWDDDEGDETWSDLRQAGWRTVKDASAVDSDDRTDWATDAERDAGTFFGQDASAV